MEMPGGNDFASLYKRLIDANLTPDPERSKAALAAVMVLLSARDPPETLRK
jgi:hypothetical protein